jgi:hypothetical protein
MLTIYVGKRSWLVAASVAGYGSKGGGVNGGMGERDTLLLGFVPPCERHCGMGTRCDSQSLHRQGAAPGLCFIGARECAAHDSWPLCRRDAGAHEARLLAFCVVGAQERMRRNS